MVLCVFWGIFIRVRRFLLCVLFDVIAFDGYDSWFWVILDLWLLIRCSLYYVVLGVSLVILVCFCVLCFDFSKHQHIFARCLSLPMKEGRCRLLTAP